MGSGGDASQQVIPPPMAGIRGLDNVLATAQALLDFPPPVEGDRDQWATQIAALVDYAQQHQGPKRSHNSAWCMPIVAAPEHASAQSGSPAPRQDRQDAGRRAGRDDRDSIGSFDPGLRGAAHPEHGEDARPRAEHLPERFPWDEPGPEALYRGDGCLALTPELRNLVWPQKFKAEVPAKYDGLKNPVEFLQLYSTTLTAAGGNDKVKANCLAMALKPNAQSWLMNLPANSVRSWPDLSTSLSALSREGASALVCRSTSTTLYRGPATASASTSRDSTRLRTPSRTSQRMHSSPRSPQTCATSGCGRN